MDCGLVNNVSSTMMIQCKIILEGSWERERY